MPRAKRICTKPGCPRIADGRYCPTHNAEYERRRGTSTQRGYGYQHQQARQAQAQQVAQGTVTCSRCGQPITAGQAWHLDHDDEDRTKYLGPSHDYCNTSAGGQQAHK